MTKVNLKKLGLDREKDVIISNMAVERTAQCNLANARSMDLKDKDDLTIAQEAITANKAQRDVLKNVIHLSDKEIDHIFNDVSSHSILEWFREFTILVFTERDFGMTPQQINKKLQSTGESKNGNK